MIFYSALLSWQNAACAVLAAIFGTVLCNICNWFSPLKQNNPTPLLRKLGHKQHSLKLLDGSYTSVLVKDEKLHSTKSGVQTLYQAFLKGLQLSNNGPCLGDRSNGGSFTWLSYQDVYDKAHALGSAFKTKCLLKKRDFVGVYSQNRVEWVLTEQAANHFSLIVVPLYDTLGPDSCSYVLKQTNLSLVVCDTVVKVEALLDCKKVTSSALAHVVVVEQVTAELVARAKGLSITIHQFSDLVAFGLENGVEAEPPSPEDVATMCYTSGTTGDPKGARLTHINMLSNVEAVLSCLEISKVIAPCNSSDIHISYLPLAHMFERLVHVICFSRGMRIGFFGGNVQQLMEDMQELKPTVFITVPRLLNRLYDKVQSGVSGSFFKKMLLQFAVYMKTRLLEQGIVSNNTIWDRLVLSKIRQLTGGKIRVMVTGSAPLSSKVIRFTRAVFGCHLLEAYGQTESTVAVSMTLPGDVFSGHVGAPLACNKVRLVDVPEMGYLAACGQGEVAIKGFNVFKGYYKNPDQTADAFDDEGWLLTGDIGEWTANGCLKIIDRRKHIFKLSQGEYVAPDKIEELLTRSPYISQVFVDGNTLNSYLVCVVVPDPDVVLPWARANSLTDDLMKLCFCSQLKEAVLNDIMTISRDNGLKGFEIPRDVYFHPHLFSVENGLLTPSFKSKRCELRRYFQTEMAAMYKS